MYSEVDRRMEESYNNAPDTPYTLIVKIWPLLRSPNEPIWQKYSEQTRKMEKSWVNFEDSYLIK